MTIKKLKFHKLTGIFPLMEGKEYEDLREDIRKNGQAEPIWTYEGEVIDGRNRYRVCEELNIEPKVREWSGKGSLISLVISLNLQRRHLTSSQRTVVALEILPLLEKEAKERQKEHAGTAPGKKGTLPEKIPEVSGGEAAEKAAEMTKTNPHYVRDAKKIEETAPEIIKTIKDGTFTIEEAKMVSKLPEKEREKVVEAVKKIERDAAKDNKIAKRNVRRLVSDAARKERDKKFKETPLPEGKFDIICADPPWEYDFSRSIGREIENQYPTMKVEAICQKIPPAADNSILFLWATMPKLREGLRVIEAWGFEYKTAMVWIKNKIGMGYYVRSTCELVLIATRGKFESPAEDLRPEMHFEADRGKHSEKPDEAYEIIERMYPSHERRLEMFSRKERKGWTAWGFEAGGGK